MEVGTIFIHKDKGNIQFELRPWKERQGGTLWIRRQILVLVSVDLTQEQYDQLKEQGVQEYGRDE